VNEAGISDIAPGSGRAGAAWLSILVISLSLLMAYDPDGAGSALAGSLCHRRSDRSPSIGGIHMPFCHRCTGLYVGSLCGIALAVLGKRRWNRSRWVSRRWCACAVVGILAAPAAVDVINSLHDDFVGRPLVYVPSNTLRLLTGAMAGVLLGVLLTLLFTRATGSPDVLPNYGPCWKIVLPIAAVLCLLCTWVGPSSFVLAAISWSGALVSLMLPNAVLVLFVAGRWFGTHLTPVSSLLAAVAATLAELVAARSFYGAVGWIS